jgi:lipoprotein LprG
MFRFRSTLALLVVLPLVLTGAAACTHHRPNASGGADLPAGDVLLRDSAAAMRDVKTAKFLITVDGTIAGLTLMRAEGTLTREGSARGTAQVTEGGVAVELSFVVVGDKIYVKGPTGGYQTLPLALASTVYDPSAILDPDRGIATVLGTATGAKTEASEAVDGQPAWRVAVTADSKHLSAIIPGVTGAVAGKVWLAASDKRLLKAAFMPSGAGGATKGTVTVTFSDYDAPVSISAPS